MSFLAICKLSDISSLGSRRFKREDGKIIVPVHRELLVVERRLQVFEEIHITPRHRQELKREDVVVRSEEAVIEREEGTG